MRITVLGKSGCGKCESAKQKLGIMRLEYTYVSLDTERDWREKRAAEAVATAVFCGLDITRPPIVVIDDMAYEYAAAMKVLKGKTCQTT